VPDPRVEGRAIGGLVAERGQEAAAAQVRKAVDDVRAGVTGVGCIDARVLAQIIAAALGGFRDQRRQRGAGGKGCRKG
jgi:hypothetical protein